MAEVFAGELTPKGVRTHTLWEVKDTKAISGTATSGASMTFGWVDTSPYDPTGYDKVEFHCVFGDGTDSGVQPTMLSALKAGGSVEDLGGGWYKVSNPTHGGWFAVTVVKTFYGEDPDPIEVPISSITGITQAGVALLQDASAFGVGGRSKALAGWDVLDLEGSGFYNAPEQKDGNGRMWFGFHVSHAYPQYSFAVRGRADQMQFRGVEAGKKGKWLEVYHSANVEKMVDAIIANPAALAKLKAALA